MLPQDPIDDEVRKFILVNIPSVSYLEAALLFRREPGSRTVDEAALALYISTHEASDILAALCEARLLSNTGEHFQYAPRDDHLSHMLDRLAHVYSTELVAVTNLIHDKTHRNARRFADAFKLRKAP